MAKPMPLRSAEDGGVDADDLAVQVQQRPPELPGLMAASVCKKSM
jgi:hypothetical protein